MLLLWVALGFLLSHAEVDSPLGPAFAGSEQCRSCQEDRHETWMTTAHAYSLREPSPSSVMGRFDGQAIETPHFIAVPYRRDGGFWIRVQRKDGRPSGDHYVSHVVGRSFEQAYLFTGPRGEWRVLPICWSLERGRWDLTHTVLADINGDPKSFPENYDAREKIFNDGCGQCHATHYDPGYDSERDTYASRFLEGAVSCESCHGPGSAHVEWHRAVARTGVRYQAPARLLHPRKDLDAKSVLASCGRCHYKHDWRYAIGDDPRVPFNDIAVSRNHDGLGFFADGRLSGLNYHGSTQSQSACFKGGMSCLSCHEMHGGRPGALSWEATADAQCAACHQKLVSTPEPHTRHKDLRCVDCHMPRLMTGILHLMRDHSLVSPEPELTGRYGEANAPNACGVCHQEKSADWARQWKERWWRPAPKTLVENVGMVVDLRRGLRVDGAKLAALAESREARLFFRLTAIRHLAERRTARSRASVRRLLFDPEDQVRQLACEAIAADPHSEAAVPLLKLLQDPVRTVRVEAAFALARCGWRGRYAAFDRAYADAEKMLERQRSFDEILERLIVLADASERRTEMVAHLALLSGRTTHLKTSGELLGRYARVLLEQGDSQKALAFAKQALGRAGDSVGPYLREYLYLDLADALAAAGRSAEAERYWRDLTSSSPPGLPRRIAAARLAALRGGVAVERGLLEEAIRRWQNDPSAGELLRRALWTAKIVSTVP